MNSLLLKRRSRFKKKKSLPWLEEAKKENEIFLEILEKEVESKATLEIMPPNDPNLLLCSPLSRFRSWGKHHQVSFIFILNEQN